MRGNRLHTNGCVIVKRVQIKTSSSHQLNPLQETLWRLCRSNMFCKQKERNGRFVRWHIQKLMLFAMTTLSPNCERELMNDGIHYIECNANERKMCWRGTQVFVWVKFYVSFHSFSSNMTYATPHSRMRKFNVFTTCLLPSLSDIWIQSTIEGCIEFNSHSLWRLFIHSNIIYRATNCSISLKWAATVHTIQHLLCSRVNCLEHLYIAIRSLFIAFDEWLRLMFSEYADVNTTTNDVQIRLNEPTHTTHQHTQRH